MNIVLDKQSKKPYYLQIVYSIKGMIASKEILHGYKLPPERVLAAELEVHRNTVIKAYGILVAEGLLTVSRKRPKGYFVDIPAKDDNFTKRFFPLKQTMLYDYDGHTKNFMNIFFDTFNKNYISFAGIKMSNESNPEEGMEDIVKSLVGRDSKGNLNIANLDETERTKNNICKILSNENMYVKPQNIQLVSETTKAINLIADLYMRKGDYILTEEPVMPDFVSIIRNKGINIVTVPMEKNGVNLEILERKTDRFRPKFIYTIPNFHNPTGITTDLDKRLKILEIAHRYEVPIIEEDSQRDFRYSKDRIPSIYSLDRLKSVVYIDSFTMLFPYGIKTGYVVGPSDMVKMLGVLVALDEIFIDNVGHFLLNEYIERGFMRSHAKELAKHYLKKRNLMCRQLDLISNKGIKYFKPDGGVIIWCELDEGIDEKLLCQMAEKRGVLVMPGYLFFPDTRKRRGYLRLCFSDVTDEEIIKGIGVIEDCLDNIRKG